MADLDVVYGVDVQCTMPFCAALNHSCFRTLSAVTATPLGFDPRC